MKDPNDASATSAGRATGWRRILSSARSRVMASYIVLLALSSVVSLVFIRQVLLVRLDEQINEGLAQEASEFSRLVKGNDPRTGEKFGTDLKRIFDVYFDRNVPQEGEQILSLVEGEPYKSARAHDAGYPLVELTSAVEQWAALTASERDRLETPGGAARYLAIPIRLEPQGRGRVVEGTFVVANFPEFEREEINDVLRVATVVSLSVLALASLFASSVAGRVLAPLKLLTNTARSITESDLTQRIPVRGHDEISELARTFNDMVERLEEAFATQRQFLDDAGHELRTPITIVRGHLELLEEDPEERRQTIELVMDELDRMARIVNDLLVLAKAEQPDFLDLEPVDVESLTADVYLKASALAPRQWRLERADPGVLVADRQRLTQALIQLAQNATQHTSEGDAIVLGSAVTDGAVRFWVRDTGPGISVEEQERIFDRFVRGNGNGTRSEGAGLGLSITRAIAEAHQGQVTVQSRPGAGATFTMIVPCKTDPDREPEEVEA